MITRRQSYRATLTKNAEGRIIENLNENINLAVSEVEYVASTLEFNPVGNGWEKFRVDDDTRAAVEYVLSIAKTVAEGAHVASSCKLRVSFNYNDYKMLAISTDGEYGHGAIRVENGFALFMAICSVTGVKPKRMKAYDINGMPLGIKWCRYFYIDLPIRVYFEDEYKAIKQATAMALQYQDGYVLSAHAKDVKLVLAAMSGRQGYASWLKHCNGVYNKLGGPNCFAWVNAWARREYQVTLVSCCDGSKRIALCSYDANGHWDGGMILLPGTEKDYMAYIQKYQMRMLTLNY